MKLILMIFFTLMNLGYASTLDGYISYSDFVMMKRADQIRAIELVHEFLTEYEFQKMHSSQKKKKYYSYLKILDYFISTAHADDENLFSQVENEHKCYFAGWVSFAKKIGNRKVCVHPQTLGSKSNLSALAKSLGKNLDDPEFLNSPEYQYFKKVKDQYKNLQGSNQGQYDISVESDKTNITEKNNACKSSSSIMCNPQIYGQYGGKVLCVTGNANYGVNSSLNCELAVKKLKVDKPGEFQDAMEGVISQTYSTNASTLTQAFETMYDTCLCGGDAGQPDQKAFQNSISKAYAKKIFYSRTCASILSHSQLIKEQIFMACKTEPREVFPESLLTFLKKVDLNLNETTSLITNKAFDQGQAKSLSQVESLFEADKKAFSQIANQNFEAAKKAGLCPVMKESSPKALIAHYNPETKILSVRLDENADEIDSVHLNNMEIKGISVEENPVASFEKIASPDSSNGKELMVLEYQYNVTPASKLSKARAYAILPGGNQINSNEVEIPGENQNDLILSYADKVLSAKVITTAEEFTLSEPAVVQEVEVAAPVQIEQETENKKEKSYSITEIDQNYEVSMTLTVGDDVITKTQSIPGLNEKFEASSDKIFIIEDIAYHRIDLKLNKADGALSNEELEKDKLSITNSPQAELKLIDKNYSVPVEKQEEARSISFTYNESESKSYESNKVELLSPVASCTLKKEVGEEKTTFEIVAGLEPTIENAELELSAPKFNNDSEGVKLEVTNDTDTSDLSASVTLKVANLSYDLENCVEAPKEPTEDDIACEVKIEQENLDDDNSKMNIKISYLGADGKPLPENDKVTTYFFDQSQKPKEEDDDDDDDEVNSDGAGLGDNTDSAEEKVETSEDRKEFMKKYREYPPHPGTESFEFAFNRGSKDRTFSIVVEGGGCDTTKEFSIKAPKSSGGNSSPNYQQATGRPAQTQGGQIGVGTR